MAKKKKNYAEGIISTVSYEGQAAVKKVDQINKKNASQSKYAQDKKERETHTVHTCLDHSNEIQTVNHDSKVYGATIRNTQEVHSDMKIGEISVALSNSSLKTQYNEDFHRQDTMPKSKNNLVESSMLKPIATPTQAENGPLSIREDCHDQIQTVNHDSKVYGATIRNTQEVHSDMKIGETSVGLNESLLKTQSQNALNQQGPTSMVAKKGKTNNLFNNDGKNSFPSSGWQPNGPISIRTPHDQNIRIQADGVIENVKGKTEAFVDKGQKLGLVFRQDNEIHDGMTVSDNKDAFIGKTLKTCSTEINEVAKKGLDKTSNAFVENGAGNGNQRTNHNRNIAVAGSTMSLKSTDTANQLETRVNRTQTLFNGTIDLKTGNVIANNQQDVMRLKKFLNKTKDKDIDAALKTQVLIGVHEGKIDAKEALDLLKKTKLSNKNGINLLDKNGNIRSGRNLLALSTLNKHTFHFQKGQSGKSKALTVGTSATGATVKGVGTVARVGGKFIRETVDANSEDASLAGINALKTAMNMPVNRAKRKAKHKVKSVVMKSGKKVALQSGKTVWKSMKYSFTMAKLALKKVLTYVAGFGLGVFLPLSLCLFIIVCLFSTFLGTQATADSLSQTLNAIQMQYSEKAQQMSAELEAKKAGPPSKGEFEGIKDDDYEALINDQWQEDYVYTNGYSDIDFQAMVSILQGAQMGIDMEGPTNQSNVFHILKYWDEKGVIEQLSTSTQSVPYTVRWKNYFTVDVPEKEFESSESLADAKRMAQEYINGYKSGDSVVSDDTSIVDVHKEVHQIIEIPPKHEGDDPTYRIIYHYFATAKGKIEKYKISNKTLTQHIYSLNISNGDLDDYLRVTNQAIQNNTTMRIGTVHFGSSGTIGGSEGGLGTGASATIPSGAQHYTFTCYDYWYQTGAPMIWSSGTMQRVLADKWKAAGSKFENGIAVYDNRYLVAVTDTLGVVGDYIDVELANGTILKCIVADAKSRTDANWTEYGHMSGGSLNVIEFEVQRSYALATGTNPGNPGWLPEWDSNVVKITNAKGNSISIPATSADASTKSKNFGQTLKFEDILMPLKGKNTDISELDSETIDIIDSLYSSEDLMEELDISSAIFGSIAGGSFGFDGEVSDPIKRDNSVSRDYSAFTVPGNPFAVPQCTWFAWARFYQVYGYSSGAMGNGCTNAEEIVAAHPDKFKLSSTPAPGSVFSIPSMGGPYMTVYGHVGFVEAVEGDTMWISEGNVTLNGSSGNIWFHKVSISSYKSQYPGIVFAVPIQK